MQAPSIEREESSEDLKKRISVFVDSLKGLAENFSSFLSAGTVNTEKLKAAEEFLDKRSDFFCERIIEYIKQYYIKQPNKLTPTESHGMAQHIGWAIREFYYQTNDYAYRNQSVAGFLSIGRLAVAASGLYGNNKEQKIERLNDTAENLVKAIHGRVVWLNQQHSMGIKEAFANPNYTRAG